MMKTKIAKAAALAPVPVEVIITVTRFKNVLAPDASRKGPGTDYTMKLRAKHPLAFIKGDNLFIKRPGAAIRFTLASSRGKATYYPVGITFVREDEGSTSDVQRLGLLNFPQGLIRPDGPALTITDSYRDEARCVRFKFSVVIQRGSDGAVGIIDPGIVHEDDE
jgi:hypothetical protein